MAMLPNLNCDDVKAGLRKLGKDYDQVADADMDAMFTQVWMCVGVWVCYNGGAHRAQGHDTFLRSWRK
eukprot:364696-Chlamydomonas_euryale.AAC.5